MSSSAHKKNRLLDIFYRLIRGEHISIKQMAKQYGVSTKSISRDIAEIKNFLSDNRDLTGDTELKYDAAAKIHYLEFDNFLLSKELFAIIKLLIGCRAFCKIELLKMIGKLKSFTTSHDRRMLDELISKEVYHYREVNHDCGSVIDYIWKLTRCINQKVQITITYYKMDRSQVERKIKPVAIMFSEYYYYLIAYRSDLENYKPVYFRIDRIVNIVEHRERFELDREHSFDEGELRSKIQFMFPGEYRRIRFEFTGPSVQAVLDKIPTAKIIEIRGNVKVIEAETYGEGIKMYLLSQGDWVKVTAPQAFVDEMRQKVEAMAELYKKGKKS